MGIALTWVAAPHLTREACLARLELAPTGAAGEYLQLPLAVHVLPAGGQLVTALACGHRIMSDASMAALSAQGEALCCSVEEHVNYACCALWQDGRRIWQVEYSAEESEDDIVCEGDVPARVAALRAETEPGFAMEIPLELAREHAGFRHDVLDPAFEAVPFDALRDLHVRPRWWHRLLRPAGR